MNRTAGLLGGFVLAAIMVAAFLVWYFGISAQVYVESHLVKFAADEPVRLMMTGGSDKEVVAAIKAFGRPVDEIRGPLGETILYYAVGEQRYSLVEWLIDEGGANPNGVRRSPLVHAIWGDDERMVRLLLKHGADPTHDPEHTMSPVDAIDHSASPAKWNKIFEEWKNNKD